MSEQRQSIHGSEQAARRVWQQNRSAETPPSAAPVRKRAAIQAAVGLAAGVVLFYLGHPILAYIAGSIAGIVLLTALVSPHGLHAQIHRGIEWIGIAIGKLLTWVLLAPFFFLFFTLFGRLARRGRRDKLERWLDRSAASYWQQRDAQPALADYERQF
jgi:hypothetical protein